MISADPFRCRWCSRQFSPAHGEEFLNHVMAEHKSEWLASDQTKPADGGTVRPARYAYIGILEGSQPASCETPDPGALLCALDIVEGAFVTKDSSTGLAPGVKLKGLVERTGIAGHWRFYQLIRPENYPVCVMQGPCSGYGTHVWGGLNLDSVFLTAIGQEIIINEFTVSLA